MGCVWGVLTSEINVATRTVNNAITIKTKVLLTQAYVILTDFGYPVYTLWHWCSQTPWYCLAFQSLDLERT
jgi:hypothetical protein